jgi:hypothetical protein
LITTATVEPREQPKPAATEAALDLEYAPNKSNSAGQGPAQNGWANFAAGDRHEEHGEKPERKTMVGEPSETESTGEPAQIQCISADLLSGEALAFFSPLPGA